MKMVFKNGYENLVKKPADMVNHKQPFKFENMRRVK